jgi:hypothetical protein
MAEGQTGIAGEEIYGERAQDFHHLVKERLIRTLI